MNIYLTGRQNTALLDRLTAENRALDEQLDQEERARQRRERKEESYARALRRFFQKTKLGMETPR